MAVLFDPDKYFHNNEWKDSIDPAKNHYERLGLKSGESYSSQHISKSFQQRYDWWREVNKRYNANPANTKTKETGPASVEAMEKLQEAYAVLSNPSKKSAYDKQLSIDSSKKAKEELIKMIHIVASNNTLTQEGRKILLNYAESLGLSQSFASDTIATELEKTGARYQPSSPSMPIIVTRKPGASQHELPNYYSVLEISATAGDQEIRDAYKRKMHLWESLSSNPKFRDFAIRKKMLLQEAADILLDHNKRQRYDYELFGKGKKPEGKPKQQKSKTITAVIGGVAMVIVAGMIAFVLNRGKNFQPSIIEQSPFVPKNTEIYDTFPQKEVQNQEHEQENEIPFRPGWLGATIQDIDSALAEAFGVNTTDGVIITEALSNSPAETTGLQSGDIIVEFDGVKMRHANHLSFIVEQTGAGKEVGILLLRDGKEMALSVVLGEQPQETASASMPEEVPPEKDVGIMVENLSENENGGVLVVDVQPESPAAKYDIKKGDIITEINRNKISAVVEFKRALISANTGEKLLLHIKRGEISLYLTVDPVK
ncbi:MAG: PDZ domain-containing protein [Candidatus Kuenenia sp.]|nr:PDZ domain-containing protein [Candidatus Kuenenia hertensis]